MNGNAVGEIGWIDLTVPDAERVRDFYSQVFGWTSSPVSMGGYRDFTMNTPSRRGAPLPAFAMLVGKTPTCPPRG